jgi:hypothetical protein
MAAVSQHGLKFFRNRKHSDKKHVCVRVQDAHFDLASRSSNNYSYPLTIANAVQR